MELSEGLKIGERAIIHENRQIYNASIICSHINQNCDYSFVLILLTLDAFDSAHVPDTLDGMRPETA